MDVRETEDGLRYYGRDISVTSALGWVFHYGGWAGYDPGDPRLLTARRRGVAVHKACEILARGRLLEEESVHPVVRPYVGQFLDFMASTSFKATESEVAVRSLRYGYAGRLDLAGTWDGAAGILDIKTTEDVWLAPYQVAAYDEAHREMTGDKTARRRGTLILSSGPVNRWKLRRFSEPTDFQVFLSALNCFKVAEANGKLRRAS